jgi:DNA-binding MarR family transcriptional regulator
MAKQPARRDAPKTRGERFEKNAHLVFDAFRELRRGPSRRLTAAYYDSLQIALEPAQVDVLELLMTKSEWRMSDAADELHVDPSTLTRMVDRLVKSGVVERDRSGLDKRGIVIKVTSLGRQQCRIIAKGRQEAMREYLRDLSDDEVETLAILMNRFTEGIARVARERSV